MEGDKLNMGNRSTEQMFQNQKEAEKAREKFYFTGRPCIRGHISPRYTIGGRCVACAKESVKQRQAIKPATPRPGLSLAEKAKRRKAYSRRYYLENQEIILEKNRQYREKNKEKIAESDKARYLRNREALLARKKELYLEKRENRIKYQREYRRRKKMERLAGQKTE